MKKTITENERLQLIGLMTLAKQHYEIVRNCERAMANLVGSEYEYEDNLSDQIYGSETYDVDEALKNIDIKVKK